MTVKAKCDKCWNEAHSIVGTRHRRCGGSRGAEPKAKYADRLPRGRRGTWQQPWTVDVEVA